VGGVTHWEGLRRNLLMRIFVPKRVEMAEGQRKLHNTDLRDFCSFSYVIRLTNEDG
jgi:hypothetical protein